MVESGAVRPIDCACGKAFMCASELGIEWQCDACHRQLLIPFGELRGREHLMRVVDKWRKEERK